MSCTFCMKYETKDEHIITENKHAFAFWDQTPATPGHALLIPKDHIVSFFDVPSEIAAALVNLAREVKQIIEKEHKPGGYTIGVNEGRVAGRSIEHVHMHIIPRYNKGNGPGVRCVVHSSE